MNWKLLLKDEHPRIWLFPLMIGLTMIEIGLMVVYAGGEIGRYGAIPSFVIGGYFLGNVVLEEE